jgi:hypothetical protein
MLLLASTPATVNDAAATIAAAGHHVCHCRAQDLAAEAGDRPLPQAQLSQALAVAQALADIVGASGGGATAGRAALEGGGGAGAGGSALLSVGRADAAHLTTAAHKTALLVPDAAGVLRPAAELAYDDAPWLESAVDGSGAGGPGSPAHALQLVHPRISAPVAEALGVASRRRLLLAASADSLALGLAGAGGAVEAFGQSEALTTRLRHIIGDYPDGPGVHRVKRGRGCMCICAFHLCLASSMT